ncbi:MAG TPA: lipocalin-like domain-containing protein [Anaerolineales bacterium]|nr:lipocalin-like domain-containing protein [Anaerolineales bacterium]
MQSNPFVGVWKLISCDAIRRNGSVLPIYGRNPIGRLYYDAAGNMSVHMMKSGRTNSKDQTKFRATPSEMRAAYESYEAYFSTYEVDEAHCLIKHTVLGGLFPNWTGTVQSRYYKFEGDHLILSTEPVGCASKDKTVVTLVWERLK